MQYGKKIDPSQIREDGYYDPNCLEGLPFSVCKKCGEGRDTDFSPIKHLDGCDRSDEVWVFGPRWVETAKRLDTSTWDGNGKWSLHFLSLERNFPELFGEKQFFKVGDKVMLNSKGLTIDSLRKLMGKRHTVAKTGWICMTVKCNNRVFDEEGKCTACKKQGDQLISIGAGINYNYRYFCPA